MNNMKWPWNKKKAEVSKIQQNSNKKQLKPNAVETWRDIVGRSFSGSNYTGDTLHQIGDDYGYPDRLDFSNYWNMYRRFGIAKSVIELPVDTTWKTPPKIEGSDALKKDIDTLIKKFKIWQRAKGLDTRQRVGRYAGMYMRVRDNQMPNTKVEALNGLGSLVEMMPLYESQLKITQTDQDMLSDTYGQPILYQYSGNVEGDRNENINEVIIIHASRIIPAAEGADSGWIYGIPALEAVFNSLMDLRKIAGAGGEGFYKNAAQSIVFELKDAASATQNKTLLGKFNEMADNFLRNRFRRSLWTPGLEAKVLESNLANPKEFFMNSLADVAAGTTPPIPSTVLIGQQTGERASTEDSKTFLSSIQSRRENFGTELVSNIIDWMMVHGILKKEEYEIIWDDLLARSDVEKMASAKDMAETNQKQFQSGQGVPFTPEEIREAAGFDESEIIDPGGEEIGDDEK